MGEGASMSWVTAIWSSIAAASLTLGLMNLAIWFKRRDMTSKLMFFLATSSVALYAIFELLMMLARTPQEMSWLIRWIHIPVWGIFVSLVGFIRHYLRAGRSWLGWSACGLRTVSLALNFSAPH